MRAALAVLYMVALIWTDSSFAFDLSTHRTILMDALYRGGVEVQGETISFSDPVVTDIDGENGALDRLGAIGISDPVWHVDDERIVESNQRIIELRSQIVAKLTDSNPRFESARGLLGRALHILTDFYAHTNWIELGNSSPNPALGTGPITQALASRGEATCGSDGATLQGVGLTKLTSGYYAGVGNCDVPAGKCRHGGPADCRRGLSKDPADAPQHAAAVSMATSAVKAFVSGLLTDVARARNLSLVKHFAQRL